MIAQAAAGSSGTLSDVYYTGNITGVKAGGMFSSLMIGTGYSVTRGYTGSAQINDGLGNNGYAVGAGSTTPPTLDKYFARASGVMDFDIAPANQLPDGNMVLEGSYLGFTFGAGDWKMPSSLTSGYHDQLSPVFDWQCNAAASHPGKAVCP
jgi:hypothetical protein